MARSSSKTLVGLDIQPGYVAAVEGRAGQVAVERAASAALAPGIVRDGEVVDVETLSSVLRDMFAENKLGKRVRIGVANHRIVMRTVDLPPLYSVKEHIPMQLDQAVLEHHSLGIVETAEGPRTRVVLVAARREMIDRLLEATRKAGLRPQGIDLSAFAMIRALHHPGTTGATLYISIGGITNLAVAMGSTCVFTRVLAQGTETMAGELAERRGLTLDHANGWLKHVGLEQDIDLIEGDADIVTEARSVLVDGVRRISDELRNSLDFHAMQAGASGVERAILTGAAAAIPGFADQLGDELGRPVSVGAVLEGKSGGFNGIDAGRLAVAAGLTVSEVPA
jgi:type IV pilus assembly protein PilM